MFLAAPTIEELQKLPMSILFDMLAYQTELMSRMLRLDGITNSTSATQELINNIQVVIENKKSLQKAK